VSEWSDIISISAGDFYTIGLKSDGTVVAAGHNAVGQCSVLNWNDIVAIDAGHYHTVGLKSDGTVDAVGLTAEATGFKSTVTFDGAAKSSAVLDPIVKIGNNDTEVHFVNGAADLDVYTTTEVDELITSRLKAADAMTFKGSLDAGAATETDGLKKALPTTDVSAGDTWIVAAEGTYAGKAANVGDLFIALEDLTTSTNANWAYVPAGNDEMPELTGEDNKIQLGFAGAEGQLGSIEVKAADNCGITATVANDVMTIGFEWGTF
jgi:hypothetical protein